MASGIRDKVAILGMGCSRFGERWDAGADALMIEAFNEAKADAGIELNQIEAANLDQTCGPSAGPLPSRPASPRGTGRRTRRTRGSMTKCRTTGARDPPALPSSRPGSARLRGHR